MKAVSEISVTPLVRDLVLLYEYFSEQSQKNASTHDLIKAGKCEAYSDAYFNLRNLIDKHMKE